MAPPQKKKKIGNLLGLLKIKNKVLKTTLYTLNESRNTWQMTWHQKNLQNDSIFTKKSKIFGT